MSTFTDTIPQETPGTRPAPEAPMVEQWSGKDRGDENFPVGSFLIRPALRAHVHAYYAFARNADDISDSPSLAADDKVARLDHMEAVLLGRRDNGSPSALRLRESLAQTRIDPVHATDLLVAFRRDTHELRYETWAELLDYCRYSASPVGRYMLDLHGESHAAYPASDALCTALQILNHVQDVAKDLRDLDRCYVPQDWLARQGESLESLRAPQESAGLRVVFDQMLDGVDALHRSAFALPPLCADRRIRLETAIICRLSNKLAARLRRQDPLAMRVKLTKADILLASIRALPALIVR